MTGLMQRIFRRRAAASEPPQEPEAQLPAGQDPDEVAAPSGPSFRDRGRMRRRLRYLRRARELGFRDLGGLVFDLRRFERERPDLVDAKLTALRAVDEELRTLEVALDDRRPIHELREPGIASCPRCGALHGSESSFCPACGTALRGPRAVGEVGEGGVATAVGEIGALEQETAADGGARSRDAAARADDHAAAPGVAAPADPAAPPVPADEQRTEVLTPPPGDRRP